MVVENSNGTPSDENTRKRKRSIDDLSSSFVSEIIRTSVLEIVGNPTDLINTPGDEELYDNLYVKVG